MMNAEELATDLYLDAPVFGPEVELLSEVRKLMSLVGELTMTLVIQGAYVNAMKNRRARPSESDVDDSIATVAESVPDPVAEGLWGARDLLLERLRKDAARG